MLAKAFKLAGLGFLLGIVIGDMIALLTGSLSTGEIVCFSNTLLEMAGGNAAAAVILQSLFSGLYGIICFVGMMLYYIDRLPLAAVTALHCAVIVITFIPIALLLGWVEGVPEIIIMAAIQIVVYFIIWQIISASYRKQVKELNDLQKDYSERK